MMRHMIDHGADPLQSNLQGSSPLSIAAAFGNLDAVMFLLRLPVYKFALRKSPAEIPHELSVFQSSTTGYYPSGFDQMQIELTNNDTMDSTHSPTQSNSPKTSKKTTSVSTHHIM